MNVKFKKIVTVGAGVGGLAAVLLLSQSDGMGVAKYFRSGFLPNRKPPSIQEMKLKSVQVFFRHGARTPLKLIPGLEEVTYDIDSLIQSVPYTEVPYVVKNLQDGARPESKLELIYSRVKFKGGVIAGMLTFVGKKQGYELGQQLAKRYRFDKQFIGSQFTDEEIYCRSTNTDRCIQTMQCLLAGLFGLDAFKNREPVVIRVEKSDDEILYPNPYSCPALRLLTKFSMSQYLATPEYANLVNRIQAHTGDTTPVENFDMMQWRDHIIVRKTYGLPVPEFLEKMYSEIDKAAIDTLMHHVCGLITENCVLGQKCADVEKYPTFHRSGLDPKLAGVTLGSGAVWKMITETLQSAVEGTNSNATAKKLYLYACHDSSLVPLLAGMGCYDKKWPPYVADVSFELYEDSRKGHWVRVTYCGKDQVLVGCSEPVIPLSKFISIVGVYITDGDKRAIFCNDTQGFSQVLPAARYD